MKHNHDSEPLRRLLSLFPYDSMRPAQVAALRVIARMFSEDRRFTVIEAPTGAGKSALAVASALYAKTVGDERYKPGAYILTPYNNLAMQMTDSFRNAELAALRGKKHYSQNVGSSYENAKSHFSMTSIGVTNYAYFLSARHLPERQVLILDEGHKVEKILTDQAAFEITPKMCSEIGVDMPSDLGKERTRIVDWLGIVVLPAINERLAHGRQINAQSEWVNLAERVIDFLESDNGDQWFVWTEREC